MNFDIREKATSLYTYLLFFLFWLGVSMLANSAAGAFAFGGSSHWHWMEMVYYPKSVSSSTGLINEARWSIDYTLSYYHTWIVYTSLIISPIIIFTPRRYLWIPCVLIAIPLYLVFSQPKETPETFEQMHGWNTEKAREVLERGKKYLMVNKGSVDVLEQSSSEADQFWETYERITDFLTPGS